MSSVRDASWDDGRCWADAVDAVGGVRASCGWLVVAAVAHASLVQGGLE